MTYNPDLQYRCTIIRGKAKNNIDDLLQAYAEVINDICPLEEGLFRDKFNKRISVFLSSPTKKTLDNHRTEIAGKLFGMWKINQNNLVYPSERTKRLLKDRDHPAFFKSLITKIQFPNGMDKLNTIKERIKMKINVRPCAFVLAALIETKNLSIVLTKDEIAYYILNNLDVLRGHAEINEVLEAILDRRKKRVFKRVEVPGKESSYSNQHITELLNLMELANLIRIIREKLIINVVLNPGENDAIDYIAKNWKKKPEFDIYKYDLSQNSSVQKMERDWSEYYTKPEEKEGFFFTQISSLVPENEKNVSMPSPVVIETAEVGEEGELIVFKHEKDRVKIFNERLANKVIYFGKQKGLGYDISSIRADNSTKAEHAIYIEVKSTKRVTVPSANFKDQFDMTRNEWVAAEQHQNDYYIYRVYITNEGVKVFKMKNPMDLRQNSKIFAEPLKYHVEFDYNSGEMMSW